MMGELRFGSMALDRVGGDGLEVRLRFRDGAGDVCTRSDSMGEDNSREAPFKASRVADARESKEMLRSEALWLESSEMRLRLADV
jgi:hypothetical protein